MATLLLFIIYLAFIGLGIPDSLLGTAWPAIFTDLGVPVGIAPLVTLPTSLCTILMSFLSARIINRFGTPTIVAVSTLLTAFPLLGFACSGSLFWMILLGIPLGLGAGCIDSALNNYVALHYNASQMSFLHCFYGVGVTASPYLLSLTLGNADDWRAGCRMVFWIQLVIALVTVAALPLWKKAHPDAASDDGDTSPSRTLRFREIRSLPGIRAVWSVYFGSVALECSCGNWASTYLVLARGMSVDTAASTVIFYYAGMTVGRFLSGVLANRLSERRIIRICILILVAAVVLLFLPLPLSAAGLPLFLLGLGNGPIFPNMMQLTPFFFGREVSQSVIGTQMAFSYIGALTMPMLFGLLAQFLGAHLLPYYLALMFGILAAGAYLLLRRASPVKA